MFVCQQSQPTDSEGRFKGLMRQIWDLRQKSVQNLELPLDVVEGGKLHEDTTHKNHHRVSVCELHRDTLKCGHGGLGLPNAFRNVDRELASSLGTGRGPSTYQD